MNKKYVKSYWKIFKTIQSKQQHSELNLNVKLYVDIKVNKQILTRMQKSIEEKYMGNVQWSAE